MGVMSKGNHRLSERPLPPTAAERDDDIQSIGDTDVVFSLGAKFLTEYNQVSPSTTPTNESPMSNISTTTTTTSDNSTTTSSNNTSLNTSTESEISEEQRKESYDDVIKLMSLYSSLKNVPSELEGKYSTLKSTADDLSGSISKLRALSLNFGVEEPASSSLKKKDEADNKVGDGKQGGSRAKSKKK